MDGRVGMEVVVEQEDAQRDIGEVKGGREGEEVAPYEGGSMDLGRSTVGRRFDVTTHYHKEWGEGYILPVTEADGDRVGEQPLGADRAHMLRKDRGEGKPSRSNKQIHNC